MVAPVAATHGGRMTGPRTQIYEPKLASVPNDECKIGKHDDMLLIA